MRHARGACVIGEIACFTAGDIALAGTHAASARTRCPVRRVRAEPLAFLSLPVRCGRSRVRVRRTGCRDRGLCGRVNAVLPPTIRNAFHRSGALAPRRPFGRPAKASCKPRGLATSRPTVDAFGAGEPCGTPAPDPRSRTSLPGRSRFSGSRRRPSTSATVTTHGHTRRARSNLARERRFHAAHARHQRLPGCVGHPAALPQPGAREPRPVRNDLRALRSTGVERGSRVEVCERSSARGRTTLRAALLGVPQHPSHRHDSTRTLDLFRDLPHRPRLVSETPSRKEGSSNESRCFRRAGTHTRTKVVSPTSVRARIGALSRRLRRGIAPGSHTPLLPRPSACP